VSTLTERMDAVERLLERDLDHEALAEELDALGAELMWGCTAGMPDVPAVSVAMLGHEGADESLADAARDWLRRAAIAAERRARHEAGLALVVGIAGAAPPVLALAGRAAR
jgi:hypothetical protein